MSRCPFLSTMEEEISCFKECALYNWADNNGKCPFIELGKKRKVRKKNLYEYDFLKDETSSPLGILYGERYF